ncbi:hypothetical protein [Myxococcus sp. CA039A]|uniref:hypothetical protein n=1 Tax=Myxococcus sp. CA039A TaxID=2741737 RepID=UPI00157B6E77|nr:hypothetical protein [Myxococcus sp. CA039A]NTX55277.1 hypothetical protein [Myxococcus sp. CA039A]
MSLRWRVGVVGWLSIIVAQGCAHSTPTEASSSASPRASTTSLVPASARIESLGLGLSESTKGRREDQNCADFVLTEPQVRAFFAQSREVTWREIHDSEDLGFAPCLVTGRLVFEDGQQVRFAINPFLVATLSYSDDSTRLLACEGACSQSVLGPP